MTSLSADEMASLREQIAKPPRAHSPSQALVRSADMVNVAPRIEDAEAGLREATAGVCAAIESALRARTRHAWTVRAHAVRTELVSTIVSGSFSPSIGVCDNGPLVVIDQEAALRFVTLLLGFDAEAAPTSTTLGVLDRQVIAGLLKGLADDVAPSLGAHAAKRATVAHAWRGIADQLGETVAVVPLETEEPVHLRIDVVVPLACMQAAATSKHRKGSERPSVSKLSVAAHVENLDVELSIELGALSLSLESLAALGTGDVLHLQNTETTPLAVYVEGERRFVGRAQTTLDGRLTLTVIDDPRACAPSA